MLEKPTKRKGVCRKSKNKILLITVLITNRRKVLEENLYIFLFLFSVFSFFFYYFSIPSVHAFSLVDMMKSALDKFEGALAFIKRIEEKGENISIALEVKLEIAKITKKIATINDIADVFTPIYGIFQGLGVIAVTINSMIYLLREFQKPDIDEQVWFRFFMVYIISMSVVVNLDAFFEAINGMMGFVVTYMTKVLSSGKAGLLDKILDKRVDVVVDTWKQKNLLEEFKDLGYGELKRASIELAFTEVLSRLMNCITDGVIYGIAIRMVLRRMFAPIAIADMASEGFRSHGVRYLKRYAAYYLQEAIILFTCATYFIISGVVIEASNNLMGMIWLQLALQGAMVGIVTTSGQMAEEILGA